MAAKDEGGPAFPTDPYVTPGGKGMTYRRWLIGQAVAGLLARDNLPRYDAGAGARPCWNTGDVAQYAVEVADAVLARLEAEEAERKAEELEKEEHKDVGYSDPG